MRLAASFALAVAVAGTLAACGSEHAANDAPPKTEDTASPTVPEDSPKEGAAGALVQLADLPSTWTEEPVSVPDLGCTADPFGSADARVAAGRYRNQGLAIQETVGIFRSPARSLRAYRQLRSEASLRCLRRNARTRMTEQVGTRASPVEVARIDDLESWGRAIRLTSTAPTQIGKTQGVIDVLHGRAEHVVGALVIVSSPNPIGNGLYEDVVAAFERRLRDASE